MDSEAAQAVQGRASACTRPSQMAAQLQTPALHKGRCAAWAVPSAAGRHGLPFVQRCPAQLARLWVARPLQRWKVQLQAAPSAAPSGFLDLDAGLELPEEGAGPDTATEESAPSRSAVLTKKRSRRYRDMASKMPSMSRPFVGAATAVFAFKQSLYCSPDQILSCPCMPSVDRKLIPQ